MSLVGGRKPDQTGLSRDFYDLIRAGGSLSGNERNCAFLSMGRQRFANVSGISGLDYPEDGRAMTVCDWDQDGDLDVWFLNRNGPQVRFLRNDVPVDNHFLALRLSGNGTTSNRDAIGARVEVISAANTKNPKSEIRN